MNTQDLYPTAHKLGKHVIVGGESLTLRDAEILHQQLGRAIDRCRQIQTETCHKTPSQLLKTYDFGAGPVPAHRNINPDGVEGGWVADTAYVAPDCFIGLDAVVYDRAQVMGGCSVRDRARVYGTARILNVLMIDDSKVCGHSDLRDETLMGFMYVHNNRSKDKKAKDKTSKADRAKVEVANPLWDD